MVESELKIRYMIMKTNIYHRDSCSDAAGLCVVIDVLRAFTTAAFAFANGVKEIIFVSTPEQAFQKHQNDPSLLLMGEVDGNFIPGFHYGNSPIEIQNASVNGRRMVQRTSSGTQGVFACRHAETILVASFVVAEATLKRIFEIKPSHVSFIVTGRNNGDEDLALAEYLQERLLGKASPIESYLNRVRFSPGGKKMLNFEPSEYPFAKEDLDLSVHLDRFAFAMEVEKSNDELIGKKIY